MGGGKRQKEWKTCREYSVGAGNRDEYCCNSKERN